MHGISPKTAQTMQFPAIDTTGKRLSSSSIRKIRSSALQLLSMATTGRVIQLSSWARDQSSNSTTAGRPGAPPNSVSPTEDRLAITSRHWLMGEACLLQLDGPSRMLILAVLFVRSAIRVFSQRSGRRTTMSLVESKKR